MAENRPNILVVCWDAARAENLSVLGYEKPTTPNLERWADRMAQYRQCVTAATWTMPSVASLFSGVYPSTHRLVIDGDRLDGRFRTLAEVLGDAGYFTAKVTTKVPYVSDFTGLDRGFALDHVELEAGIGKRLKFLRRDQPGADPESAEAPLPEPEEESVGTRPDPEAFVRKVEADMRARSTLRARFNYWLSGFNDVGARGCMDKVAELWRTHADEPKFVYVHLMETHAEYRPPHAFRKRFLAPHLRGRNFAAINQRPNPHAAGVVDMSAEDFEVLTGLYDGCIAYADQELGRLLDELARRPDFDDTLVVVTADHGDCLGRHGVLGHQFVCYEELLHIPWIVKWPRSVGITGARDELIQTVDFLPTLCALLGIETPAQCEGIDHLSATREIAFAELLKPFAGAAVVQGLAELAPHYKRGVLAARSRTHKLIAYSNDQPEELYDLAADPREAHDLLAEDRAGWSPALASAEAALRAALEERRPRWLEALSEIDGRIYGDANVDLSPRVEAQLRALGYLD